jgi:hypothetical protein
MGLFGKIVEATGIELESENVPQTDRSRFDEFLRLGCRLSDFVTVRNRTERAAMMRLDARYHIPEKRLSFPECDSDFGQAPALATVFLGGLECDFRPSLASLLVRFANRPKSRFDRSTLYSGPDRE